MKRSIAIVAGIAAAFITLAPSARADTTVTVRQGDVDGVTWFETETGSGAGDFVTGPGAPPLGTGSYQLTTPDGSAKANLKTVAQRGSRLDAIDAMGYSTHRSSVSTGQPFQVPAINMEIFTNASGPDTGYATLVFEPVYQPGGASAIVDDTWQDWDAYASGAGVWWSTKQIGAICAFNCFVAWNDIVAAAPAGTVLTYGVNQGSGNAGIVASTDALAIGIDGNTTTYDFEPDVVAPTTKDDCKKGGWKTYTEPTFRNQGDCVSFVATGGRNGPRG